MNEHDHDQGHEHTAKGGSPTQPTRGEVATQAYAIYTEEGNPQGHAEQNWLGAEARLKHPGHMHMDEHDQDHHGHHAHMAADYRKRFWISLVLTLPILVLSPLLQKLVGLREAISFSGDTYVLFGFASAVFWYGGWRALRMGRGDYTRRGGRTDGHKYGDRGDQCADVENKYWQYSKNVNHLIGR